MNWSKIISRLSVCFLIIIVLLSLACQKTTQAASIDRKALVHRHLPTLDAIDPLSPFTVGNGEFAFTTDVTGLQTLPEEYEQGIPLVTQSQWGWHSVPNDTNVQFEETVRYFDTYGRSVPYASIMDSKSAHYFRANPHRLHLGRIGLKYDNGDDIAVSDISGVQQKLDMWQGILQSSFRLRGKKMVVETCAHPTLDQIAVTIESQHLDTLKLGVAFEFPYASLEWGNAAADWHSPNRHTSTIVEKDQSSAIIKRQMDSTCYYVRVQWQGNAELRQNAAHVFVLSINSPEQFAFTCHFSSRKAAAKDDARITLKKSRIHWQEFWQTGGAVDLSASTDPRAMKLERRIVLSQYLTAIQCSGSLPPQETGLTANSWYGKFHLEMHWWHAVHFVLWGRPGLLEKSLPWYKTILPAAREKAKWQGYDGVRWPKMTGPDGVSSPSGVGEFLIWQQPHPIYYAELLYRYYQHDAILQKYKNIVFQTADFMASYAHWDEEQARYLLGPPLIPAQEIYPPDSTVNPAFELSYWKYGLQTAQQWRRRLAMAPDSSWQHVIDHLSALPENNGFYQNAENALHTFQDARHRNDHPTVLGAFGMLPNESVDMDKMRRTLEHVMASWNWQRTWGWDYPLVAMTATRVGMPDIAIDALLMDMPKNTFLNNGHNYQSERLPLYLPGNGGLLTAVAMMAAGWDGAPDIHAPGFPGNGRWIVKYKGLERLP